MKYAFDKLNADEVFARADSENINSSSVLEKVGLKFIEAFDLDGIKHNWYKIDKREFEYKTR